MNLSLNHSLGSLDQSPFLPTQPPVMKEPQDQLPGYIPQHTLRIACIIMLHSVRPETLQMQTTYEVNKGV